MNNTTEFSDDLLHQLSAEKVAVLIPLIVVLAIFLLLGIPGNALVVYFFWKPSKRSTTAVFILFLAIFDFCTCFFSMPVDIALLGVFLRFHNHAVCKMYMFANHLSAISAALTLVLIAIDRYRRVCMPLIGQFTLKQAWIGCTTCICISVVLSGPALLRYDILHVEFKYGGRMIHAYDCHAKDASTAALAYGFFIFALFTVGSILLLVVYSLIGKVLITKSREIRAKEKRNIALRKSLNNYYEDANQPDTTSWAAFKKEMRYTINMLVVAALFIFSYIPYFSLSIWSLFLPAHHILHFNDFGFVTYEFGLRSFFLHPCMNPIAYAIFHVDFNQFIVDALRKMKRRVCGGRSRTDDNRGDSDVSHEAGSSRL